MHEDGEDEEGDGHGDWAGGVLQSEEADEADFGEVEADEEVGEGVGVDEAARVDLGVVNVEDVKTVDEVDEAEADGAEAEDQRSDAGVADDCDFLASEVSQHTFGESHL